MGEFGSVAMCKRIYKEQTSEQGDVPFFKIGTFGADPDAFISNELFEDFKRTYPYPAPGTLLISAAGSIGRIVEYQGEKAYFQDSNIVWLEHDHRLNDAFLKPLYSQIEWGLEGSTIKRLYNKDLLSAEVTIPDDREQKVIGQFFAKLDNLITLHQRKFEKLVQLKKSMLDKMFPKPGERFPEIRFAGFTDPWEQRKLGELTTILSAVRVHKEEWRTAGVPFYRSSDVMAAFKGTENERVFISQELFEQLSAQSGAPQKGDVMVTGGGSVGTPYIVPDNKPLYTKDADLIWIKRHTEINPKFLYSFFISPIFKSYIRSISHVGTIAHYTIEQVKETPLLMPCSIVEQKAIGSFLGNLDSLITLHQRKLELLRNTKKSLLDRMFV